MWRNKIASLFIASMTLCLCACSDDDKTPADADDNFITALSLTKDGVKYDAVIDGNDIVVTVPYTVNLNGATADMVYTPSAKILPNPASVTDWDNDMVFRVTSFNGEANEYTYKVVKSEIESQGDVILKTQADVDAFAETKVSVIRGNLVIGDNAENATTISNLTALSGVKEISGALQILDNYKGEALDGLTFTKVGGIQFGTKETASKCVDTYRFRLEALQELTGDIQINNSKVQFIEFDNLTGVTGNVYIKGDAVTAISFPKLAVIEGDFDLRDNMEMPLTDFSMPLLEKVSGCFSMIQADHLKSIILPKLKSAGSIDFLVGWGLSKLQIPEITDVNGNLLISSRWESTMYSHTCNSALEKIEGLNKLSQIKGILTISQFGAVIEFPDLNTLSVLGGIEVSRMDGLYTRDAVCDLSNVTFQSFNGIKPFIDFNGEDTLGGTWFKELKTKEDLSDVDVITCLELKDDGIIPKMNFRKVGSFKARTVNMQHLSKNTPSPQLSFNEVMGDVYMMPKNHNAKILNLSNFKSIGGNFNMTYLMGGGVDLSNLELVGGWMRLVASTTKELKLNNLKTVGMSEKKSIKSRAISVDDLKEIFYIQLNGSLDLPSLEFVGGTGAIFQNFTHLNCPKLSSVESKLVLLNATKCTQISFPELKSVPKVQIEKMSKLTDFSTFGPLFENGSVTEGNWEVTGCAYNPTWQDMKEGRYKPAE